MKNTFIVLFLIISINSFPQDKLIQNESQMIHSKDSVIEKLNNELLKKQTEIINLKAQIEESKKVRMLNHSGTVLVKGENNKTIFEFIFPSIIALVVGLFALIGTIYTGEKQRTSSEKQLEKQLEQSQKTVQAQIQSTKETINLQIQSAKEISESQIKTAYDTAELSFRQNVLSSNRKEWIEKLRIQISELSSKMLIASVKPNFENYEEILQLTGYIELMLNVKDSRDSALLDIINSIPKLIADYSPGTSNKSLLNKRNELLEATKIILKSEWERVKKGE